MAAGWVSRDRSLATSTSSPRHTSIGNSRTAEKKFRLHPALNLSCKTQADGIDGADPFIRNGETPPFSLPSTSSFSRSIRSRAYSRMMSQTVTARTDPSIDERLSPGELSALVYPNPQYPSPGSTTLTEPLTPHSAARTVWTLSRPAVFLFSNLKLCSSGSIATIRAFGYRSAKRLSRDPYMLQHLQLPLDPGEVPSHMPGHGRCCRKQMRQWFPP